MFEFYNYPKIKRIPFSGIHLPKGKKPLNLEDTKFLLSGKVLIDEKMDGKQTAFNSGRFVIWTEDMKITHSINYKIPGRYFVFDVFDKQTGQFLIRDDMLEITEKMRKGEIQFKGISPIMFIPVAKIAHKKFEMFELIDLIQKSNYAFEKRNGKLEPAFMEGIVIKQNRYLFPIEIEYSRGKIVRQEFKKGIEENYLKKPIKENIIDPSIPITYEYSYTMETV